MLGIGLCAIAAFLAFFVWRFEPEIRKILTRGLQLERGKTKIVIPGENPETGLELRDRSGTATAAVEVADAKPRTQPTEKPEPKTADDWANEMYAAFFIKRDPDQLETAFKQLQQAETDPKQKLNHELMYHFLRYQCGNSSALSELNRLATIPEASARANFWIGRCHEDAGDLDRALNAYERALKEEQDQIEKAGIVAAIARCIFEKGQKTRAYARVIHELATLSDFTAKGKLYGTLADLYMRANNHEMRAIALEKALEFRPNDTTLRFGAGYSYSEARIRALAYSHYQRLLTFQPEDEGALNNLGVETERLNLPLTSISYYKRAWDKSNTLAAANIAFRLIAGGFEEEARTILDDAKSKKEMHPNVGSAFATLSKNKEGEQTRNATIRDQGLAQQQFFQRFGNAYFVETSGDSPFPGQWLSTDGYFIDVRLNNDQLDGSWEIDKKKHKFAGVSLNDGAVIDFFRWDFALIQGEWQWGFTDDGHGYIFVDRQANRLFILRFYGENHWFLTATRVIPPSQLPAAETPALVNSKT